MEIGAGGMGAEEAEVGIEADWMGVEANGTEVEILAERTGDSDDPPAVGPTQQTRWID